VSARKLSIGDKVVVVYRSVAHAPDRVGRISQPFVLERQHKGTRNFLIGGLQWRDDGHPTTCGRNGELVLLGSREHEEACHDLRLHRTQAKCRDAIAKVRVWDLGLESATKLLNALQEIQPDEKEATKEVQP